MSRSLPKLGNWYIGAPYFYIYLKPSMIIMGKKNDFQQVLILSESNRNQKQIKNCKRNVLTIKRKEREKIFQEKNKDCVRTNIIEEC
jgi:hypothetical protein